MSGYPPHRPRREGGPCDQCGRWTSRGGMAFTVEVPPPLDVDAEVFICGRCVEMHHPELAGELEDTP